MGSIAKKVDNYQFIETLTPLELDLNSARASGYLRIKKVKGNLLVCKYYNIVSVKVKFYREGILLSFLGGSYFITFETMQLKITKFYDYECEFNYDDFSKIDSFVFFNKILNDDYGYSNRPRVIRAGYEIVGDIHYTKSGNLDRRYSHESVYKIEFSKTETTDILYLFTGKCNLVMDVLDFSLCFNNIDYKNININVGDKEHLCINEIRKESNIGQRITPLKVIKLLTLESRKKVENFLQTADFSIEKNEANKLFKSIITQRRTDFKLSNNLD